MGGNAHVVEEGAAPLPQPEKTKVQLLACTCGDCLHWEIGHGFIICKTCGHAFDEVVVTVGTHEKLVWQEHER